jgi:retinol dehydrogenase-12
MCPDQKTCLITGATSGIGEATALALGTKGFRIIAIGRNEKKLEQIKKKFSSQASGGDMLCYLCDLSLMADVRSATARILDSFDRIDVLINNAGARFLRHGLTAEGIERTLATNHLGHYLLTLSLLGALKRSGAGRIINVSSGAHLSATGVIENIRWPKNYDGRRQYANSKLANILFTNALAKRLAGAGITVNAVNPGGVATNFARNNGLAYWLKHRAFYMVRRELLSPAQGAQTIVHLASSGEIANVSGKYFYRFQEASPSALSRDSVLQEKLWSMSRDLASLDIEPIK